MRYFEFFYVREVVELHFKFLLIYSVELSFVLSLTLNSHTYEVSYTNNEQNNKAQEGSATNYDVRGRVISCIWVRANFFAAFDNFLMKTLFSENVSTALREVDCRGKPITINRYAVNLSQGNCYMSIMRPSQKGNYSGG